MILLGGQNLKLSVMLPRKEPRNGIGTLEGSSPCASGLRMEVVIKGHTQRAQTCLSHLSGD